ncbi:MAG: non-hydrolyzing UDP-N-acetylglucosamine 2-epimerase [Cyclobacteriaceae bacterium]
MKILTVLGARPQFIKAAAVSRQLRKFHQEKIIHTGQHYDSNMSEVFFKELSIPTPDFNLGVGSGSHAEQTASMLIGIEKILLAEKPDYVMVYGDTNSTLAGALASSKLLFPLVHIEAGLRSYNKNMPEEQNRILTDHLSKLLFCPTETAVENLKNEGITKGVHKVGDVMSDAVHYYSKQINHLDYSYFFYRLIPLFGPKQIIKNWYLATIHRAENTNSVDKINEVLKAFEQLDAPVIFPVHPRTKNLVKELYINNQYKNTLFVEPIGYLDMLFFTKNANKVITDSGGLQKEAYILNTPTVTVRDQTEWVETLIGNYNVLCKPTSEDILNKVFQTKVSDEPRKNYYGNGDASENICAFL